MLKNIAIGCCLVALTTFVHAATMVAVLQGLKLPRTARWNREVSIGLRATIVAAVVLAMFLVSVVESGLRAATFLFVGAITKIEQALSFSTVTDTTLGFGDIVLSLDWRLLSSFAASNGILMFGWSTAIIAWTVQRVYSTAPEGG